MLPPGRSVVRLQYLQEGYVALPSDAPSPLSIKSARFADPRIAVTYASGVSAELSTTFRRASNEWTLAVSNPAPRASEQELLFAGTSDYTNAEHRRFYAEGVRAFDREMGRLITELKRRGQYEDSAIVFLSDHGEMLGEHDAWGHIRDLYEEAMHIPLVVKAPGVEMGSADDRRLDLRDVHRALLGIPDGQKLDLPRAARPGDLIAVAFPVSPEAPSIAIYRDHFKLLSTNNGEETRLFDVRVDPAEQKDLVKTPEGLEAVRGMWDTLQREWRVVKETLALTPAPPSEEQKEALKALGYVAPARTPAKK
jgi:arylsulfatase A-like enzyme